MNPNLGINDKDRAGVVKILNTLLADEYVLYTKTRNYHWNVVGPQFNDLHKFFGEQYGQLDDFVDDETIIRQLRADADTAASKLHDAGTNDFLTGLMESHEKMAWMLRAFLE